MKKTIKISAVLMAIVLMLTAICNHGMVAGAAKATKVGNGMYTVTSEKKKEARFDKVSSKTKTTLVIPATVKIGKITYKVTAVRANALKGNTKIKKLTIGKNVKKIGKNSFSCKNLKSINIKTTKLTLKSVGKNAFKGLNSKVKIKVPASKFDAYQKLLKARGVNGSNQVINSDKPTATSSPKKPAVIPDPETKFVISKDSWLDTTTEASFSIENNIPFLMSIRMPYEMYGSWSVREKQVNKYERCNICKKFFDIDTNNLAIHQVQYGHGGDSIVSTPSKSISMWYWTLDNTLCKVVYHTTLPEGLSVNKDSVEVWRQTIAQINQDEGGYDIQVSGQELTVTINDIKQGVYNNYSKAVVYATVVKFSARLEETAANVNQVNANIAYNYGKGDKAITPNPVTVRKK